MKYFIFFILAADDSRHHGYGTHARVQSADNEVRPKMVEFHPGRVAAAKSQDTMVWTVNMTGMMAKAKMFMAVPQVSSHSPSVPRKPSDRIR